MGHIFFIWMQRENWMIQNVDSDVAIMITSMLVEQLSDEVRELHNAHLVVALFENSRKAWEARDGDMGVLLMSDVTESMTQIVAVLAS